VGDRLSVFCRSLTKSGPRVETGDLRSWISVPQPRHFVINEVGAIRMSPVQQGAGHMINTTNLPVVTSSFSSSNLSQILYSQKNRFQFQVFKNYVITYKHTTTTTTSSRWVFNGSRVSAVAISAPAFTSIGTVLIAVLGGSPLASLTASDVDHQDIQRGLELEWKMDGIENGR